MDGVSLAVGIVPIVVQLYKTVSLAYDTYIEYKEFPTSYRELQCAFLIERERLRLWGNKMLSSNRQGEIEISQQEMGLWKLFEIIFKSMVAELEEGSRMIGEYRQVGGVPEKSNLSELEILESLSLAPASSSKSTLSSVSRTFKFILRDRKKIERLIKKLRDYNDSLNSMTSQLEQESSRRRLRARLPTDDPEKIRLLQAAAALLNHHDIEKMANARNVVEEGYTFEQSSCLQGQEDNFQVSSTDYLLHYDQLNFHGVPFSADQSRTIATFRGETVLVDWRCCRDVTWRRENPAAFQQRTENLARILNSDLRSLNLSVLHCVGYINQNSTVTGYAFRLPPDAHPGESPVSLHHLLTHVKVRLDIPGLDERFELAKALVSTIFEFHNMGWMHKNLQSKNILFWPKRGSSEVNLGKPYLVGFDTSRPNQPGEVTEKPYSTKEDDLYRHPNYKGPDAQSFQLPFDLYSLGVILFEIGLWESVSSQNGNRSRQGTRPSVHSSVSYSDPRYINLIMKGPVMDLKRHVGTRYRDAVMKCLDQSFDSVWDSAIGNKMEIFQDEVQNKVVDVIASCHA